VVGRFVANGEGGVATRVEEPIMNLQKSPFFQHSVEYLATTTKS